MLRKELKCSESEQRLISAHGVRSRPPLFSFQLQVCLPFVSPTAFRGSGSDLSSTAARFLEVLVEVLVFVAIGMRAGAHDCKSFMGRDGASGRTVQYAEIHAACILLELQSPIPSTASFASIPFEVQV